MHVANMSREGSMLDWQDEPRPARVDIRSELKDSFRDLWSGAICCDARKGRADKQEATANRIQQARGPDSQAQVAQQGVLTAPQGMSLVHMRGGGMDGHLQGCGLQVEAKLERMA